MRTEQLIKLYDEFNIKNFKRKNIDCSLYHRQVHYKTEEIDLFHLYCNCNIWEKGIRMSGISKCIPIKLSKNVILN